MPREFDAAQTWREIADRLVPRLRLDRTEQAIYYHLVRRTRLDGLRRLHTTFVTLSNDTGITREAVRDAIRRLSVKGAVRIILYGRNGRGFGHSYDVFLPREIPQCRRRSPGPLGDGASLDIEAAGFFADPDLREAIHRRERNRCFYCARSLRAQTRTLDHVVPQVLYSSRHSLSNQPNRADARPSAKAGRSSPSSTFSTSPSRSSTPRASRSPLATGHRSLATRSSTSSTSSTPSTSSLNSYRNLVSCCMLCNFEKADSPARDFLRSLLRSDRLSLPEFRDRLRSLRALARGKLKPVFPRNIPRK
jgi:hypothetical protein